MNYGHGIRIARAARGLRQKDLAEAIGANASYISLLEANKRTPSLETLEKIAGVLGVPLYLIVLMGTGREGLSNISQEDAESLGGNVLKLLLDLDAEWKHRPA